MSEFCDTCPLAGKCRGLVNNESFVSAEYFSYKPLGGIERTLIQGFIAMDLNGNTSEVIEGVDINSFLSRIDTCERKAETSTTTSISNTTCDALGVAASTFKPTNKHRLLGVALEMDIGERKIASRIPVIPMEDMSLIDDEIPSMKRRVILSLAAGLAAAAFCDMEAKTGIPGKIILGAMQPAVFFACSYMGHIVRLQGIINANKINKQPSSERNNPREND